MRLRENRRCRFRNTISPSLEAKGWPLNLEFKKSVKNQFDTPCEAKQVAANNFQYVVQKDERLQAFPFFMVEVMYRERNGKEPEPKRIKSC